MVGQKNSTEKMMKDKTKLVKEAKKRQSTYQKRLGKMGLGEMGLGEMLPNPPAHRRQRAL